MNESMTISASGKSSWECHRCHKINAPHIDRCDCVSAAPFPRPIQPIQPIPFVWPNTGTGQSPYPPQRCAFDGLPPGPYGLYCGCPRCSPVAATTSTVTFRENADGTFTYPFAGASQFTLAGDLIGQSALTAAGGTMFAIGPEDK